MPAQHVRDADLSKFVIQHRRPAPAVPAEKPKAESPPPMRSRDAVRGFRRVMLLARRNGDEWSNQKRYFLDEKIFRLALAVAGNRWELSEPDYFAPRDAAQFCQDLQANMQFIGEKQQAPFSVLARDPEGVEMVHGLVAFLAANAGATILADHVAGGF